MDIIALDSKLLSTGNTKLDELLGGPGIRIPEKGDSPIILICGTAGTGKTTLALQIATSFADSDAAKENGIPRYENGKTVCFYSLEQGYEALLHVKKSFGFGLKAKKDGGPGEPDPKEVKLLDMSTEGKPAKGSVNCFRLQPMSVTATELPKVFEQRLAQLKHVLENCKGLGGMVVFIDSLNALTAAPMTRADIQNLFLLFRHAKVPLVITAEDASESRTITETAQFQADVVIKLTKNEKDYVQYYIEITKSRLGRQMYGRHLYKIRTENRTDFDADQKPGIVVYPSIHAALTKAKENRKNNTPPTFSFETFRTNLQNCSDVLPEDDNERQRFLEDRYDKVLTAESSGSFEEKVGKLIPDPQRANKKLCETILKFWPAPFKELRSKAWKALWSENAQENALTKLCSKAFNDDTDLSKELTNAPASEEVVETELAKVFRRPSDKAPHEAAVDSAQWLKSKMEGKSPAPASNSDKVQALASKLVCARWLTNCAAYAPAYKEDDDPYGVKTIWEDVRNAAKELRALAKIGQYWVTEEHLQVAKQALGITPDSSKPNGKAPKTFDIGWIMQKCDVKPGACFAILGAPGTHRLALGMNLATGRLEGVGTNLLILSFGETAPIDFSGVAWFHERERFKGLQEEPDLGSGALKQGRRKWWTNRYSIPKENNSTKVAVLTFELGELTPEECFYAVQQVLDNEKKENIPYTSVLVIDTDEIATGFPLLAADKLFIPSLIELLQLYELVSVWIGHKEEGEPLRDLELAIAARSDFRINLAHSPENRELPQKIRESYAAGARGDGIEQAVWLVIDNVTGKDYNRKPRWLWVDNKVLHCSSYDQYCGLLPNSHAGETLKVTAGSAPAVISKPAGAD